MGERRDSNRGGFAGGAPRASGVRTAGHQGTNAPWDTRTVAMTMATAPGQCLGCHPGGHSGRDIRAGDGCYMPCGTRVLSPAPPQPRHLDFYLSHLINPGSGLCLFTASDYYLVCPILCFSSNIVSALKGNEHEGKYLTFSLSKFH